MGRLRSRLRYLWRILDPYTIAVVSGSLSATFVLVLLYWGRNANALDHAHGYAALCATSAALKFLGVAFSKTFVVQAGLLLGAVFWITLSYVFLRSVGGSITWLCFAVLAAWQVYATVRLARV